MPAAPRHPCAYPTCAELVARGKAYCEAHLASPPKVVDVARARSQALYNTKRWREMRLAQLRKQPLCERCLKEGRVTHARVADHVKPHNGDERLFFDANNLQSLCDHTSPFNCHGTKTSHEANARRARGV